MWLWLQQLIARLTGKPANASRPSAGYGMRDPVTFEETIAETVPDVLVEEDEISVMTPREAREKRRKNLFSQGMAALKEMIGQDLELHHAENAEEEMNMPVVSDDPESIVSSIVIPENVVPINWQETISDIKNLRQLPALASINKMLSSTTANWNAELEDVANVVRQDPALSAKVLRLANSAYVAPASRVESILQALHLLGLDQVEYLSTSMVTLPDMINFVESINWRNLWTHNFACGLMSKEIVTRLGIPAQSSIYLGGLMHDLGKVALSFLYPETYTFALKAASEYFVPLYMVEKRLFGLTHEEAAGIYGESAQLPVVITDIMRHHRKPEEAEEEHRHAVAVVALANHFCKQFGIGFSGSLASLDGDTVSETTAWQILADGGYGHEKPEEFEAAMEERTLMMRREITDLLSGMI